MEEKDMDEERIRSAAFEKLEREGRLNKKVKNLSDFNRIINSQSNNSIIIGKVKEPNQDPAMLILKERIKNLLSQQGNPAANNDSYIKKLTEMKLGIILEIYLDQNLSKIEDSENLWFYTRGEVASSIDLMNLSPNAKIEYLQVKCGSTTLNNDAKNSKNYTKDNSIKIWWRFNRANGTSNWENFPVKHPQLNLNEKEFLELVKTIEITIDT